MTLQMPDDKLEIIKLITSQHIASLNEDSNAGLDSGKLTIQQLIDLLGIHRSEAGDEDTIDLDEEPEGWLCGADGPICGVH